LGDARPIPSFEGSPASALEIVPVAGLGLNLSPLPNRTTSAFNFRRHQTLITYRRPNEPRRKGVVSCSSVNLFMCTGGAYRPFLHDRHFNAALPKPLAAKPASQTGETGKDISAVPFVSNQAHFNAENHVSTSWRA
jgi:hypothetical protein